MLSNFNSIRNSLKFPLEKIISVLDWRMKEYKTSFNEVQKLENENEYIIPVFSIGGEKYVPKSFKKKGSPAYPGMKKTNIELFEELKEVKKTTIPIITEVIDGFEFGLIRLIENSKNISEIGLYQNDFRKIIQCGLELSKYDVFHLDLNYSNILKSDNEFYFIDPSIAEKHFRPVHNYFNERALTYHWAPEILEGGLITEKSSVYSLGETLKLYKNKIINNKIRKIVELMCEEKQENRPTFKEINDLIKQ